MPVPGSVVIAVLPVAAEAHPVIPLCPVDIVSELIGARVAVLRDVDVGTDLQPAKEGNQRAVQTEAEGRISANLLALGLGGRSQPVSEVRVGKPEVADQFRREHAGQSHLRLVSEVV